MYFLVFLCTALTLFASSLSSQLFNDRFKDLSDAEIAIIELQPPNDLKERTQSNNVSPNLRAQESLTSSFITYDDSDEESQPKPFTITFPITRSSPNKQSVQSIVIPLPSSLDDKTGIIVIEDSDDGGVVDRRTLRAQFFSPNRIRSFKPQTPRPVNERNETEFQVNRISTSNKLLRSNKIQTTKRPITTTTTAATTTTTKTEATTEPSTVGSVVFDDEIVVPTSTFSPESVFRPKVSSFTQNNKRQNLTKLSPPTADTISINLQTRQRINRKFTLPETITTPIPTTPTTISPTTQFLEVKDTTESTTFTTPETTTRRKPTVRQTISANSRPNVRRKSILNSNTTSKITTTTSRPTTQRPTTITTIPTTLTTQKFITTTESDFVLIPLENSTQTEFDRNSLRLVKAKNKTSSNSTITKPRPPGTPQIPGNFGFLPSGEAFNLPQNVPGNAGTDYPTYDKIPVTNFDCREQLYPGFYSDMEAGCQVYHSCNGRSRPSKHTFLCPNGTIFSQEYLICDWWYNVKCEDSPIYYPLNKEAFSSDIISETNSTKPKNKKRIKPKTITNQQVVRTTDLP